MNPSATGPDPSASSPVGKTRTWWHPLLANLLRWQLGSAFRLEEEVPVGRKPLQIDILLLRKEQSDLPAGAHEVLAGLVERLGELTLLEFKSPTDTLRGGDFQTFLAYAMLYRTQNDPLLDPSRLHTLVLAPRLTGPYREELAVLGVTAEQEEPGIWRLRGGPAIHPTWVLETALLAGVGHPLLTLVSPALLENRVAAYEQLREGGYTNLVVYLAQQINQFRLLGTEFAMQHLGSEDQMQQALRDLLASLPLEERLVGASPEQVFGRFSPEQRLGGLSPEQRLGGLSPEQRLSGLSPEELVQGLDDQKRERLRQLLAQQAKPDNPPSSI